jgi:hypothetical protein
MHSGLLLNFSAPAFQVQIRAAVKALSAEQPPVRPDSAAFDARLRAAVAGRLISEEDVPNGSLAFLSVAKP